LEFFTWTIGCDIDLPNLNLVRIMWLYNETGAGTIPTKQHVDFGDFYLGSNICTYNEREIRHLSKPLGNDHFIRFKSDYATPFTTQMAALLGRAFIHYWHCHSYNFLRMAVSILVGLIFGSVFHSLPYDTEQRLFGRLGLIYLSTVFIGVVNMVRVVGTEILWVLLLVSLYDAHM